MKNLSLTIGCWAIRSDIAGREWRHCWTKVGSVGNKSWLVGFRTSVGKFHEGSLNFNFKHKVARVIRMDYTMGKLVQRMKEVFYSSRRSGKTVFHNISNRLNFLLRLWCFQAKEDKFSVVGSLNRFRCLSKGLLLGHEVWNVFFEIFILAAQFKNRESTACCMFYWVTKDYASSSGCGHQCRKVNGAYPDRPLFSSCLVGGVAKDSVTRRSWRWSSIMVFRSFKRRFTRYSIDSAKPANFANISLVLMTQFMGTE